MRESKYHAFHINYWRKKINEINNIRTFFSRTQFLLNQIKYHSITNVYRCISPKADLISFKNWDNLIILDACRFDVFEYYNNIPGKLKKIISAGSETTDWLFNNFAKKNMDDTIYISGNPWGSNIYLTKVIGHVPFFKIIEVWKDGWNEKLGTVLPSMLNKAIIKSVTNNPNKRHLIHYMQPHFPYIVNKKLVYEGMTDIRENVLKDREWKGKTIWTLFREGKISSKIMWEAYCNNLILVLQYVKKILPYLHGSVYISSDHGDLFGKYGIFYGHPPRTPLPELVEVPWLEVAR